MSIEEQASQNYKHRINIFIASYSYIQECFAVAVVTAS